MSPKLLHLFIISAFFPSPLLPSVSSSALSHFIEMHPLGVQAQLPSMGIFSVSPLSGRSGFWFVGRDCSWWGIFSLPPTNWRITQSPPLLSNPLSDRWGNQIQWTCKGGGGGGVGGLSDDTLTALHPLINFNCRLGTKKSFTSNWAVRFAPPLTSWKYLDSHSEREDTRGLCWLDFTPVWAGWSQVHCGQVWTFFF